MLTKPWAKLLRHRADVVSIAVVILVVGLAVFAGYQRLFSSFAANDDEGYVMVSLFNFLCGQTLYDEIYSQYGPAYYWIASAFHRLTDWQVTHDVTRFKTLAIWMTVALLAAGWIYRETRSRRFAAMGFLFVTWHLERLAMEPGHPQEFCLLAVVFCLVLTTLIRGTKQDYVVFVACGLASAISVMTKVNVGVFLLLSMSAAMLFVTHRGRIQRVLLCSTITAMVALPIVIGRHQLFDLQGYRLPVVISISIAIAVWSCRQLRVRPVLMLSHMISYWAAVIVLSVMIALATLANGTSVGGLLNGVLLQHTQFVDIHYHAPPISVLAPLVALLAVWLARGAFNETMKPYVVYVSAMLLLFSAAVCHLVETFHPLYHGSQDRGQVGMLVSFLLPFAWIVLLPLVRESQANSFSRIVLCLVAVLQPLIAHPVPGTQMAIGSVALVMVILVGLHDYISRRTREGTEATAKLTTWFQESLLRHFATIVVVLLLLTTVCRGVYLWDIREQRGALMLGATCRLKLPLEQTDEIHWIDDQLRGKCDTFVCWPSGRNSFRFFTGVDFPTGLNATCWPDLLNDKQQLAVVEALKSHHNPRVVIDHDEPRSDRQPGPLLSYIQTNFEPVARRGSIEILQRQGDEQKSFVTLAPEAVDATDQL